MRNGVADARGSASFQPVQPTLQESQSLAKAAKVDAEHEFDDS